jgi:TRAP-type mannitol/chloroaromatic compound transport system permease large subunit
MRTRTVCVRPPLLRLEGADTRRTHATMIETFITLLAHNMAPIMFASLVVVLLLGYPVAFSLAATGLIFGAIGIYVTHQFTPNFLQALPERVYGIMSNEVLLAIPFFTFMGLILERSGMAEDLLDTIGQLFGTVRGGLAYAVIFVGALLAATTGVVAASVISMGLISLPIMLRYGYDRRLATGVIAASGTLAQIIPPSLVLIVMADQLGRSVGDMYKGAFLPGLMLAAAYALYVFIRSMLSPKTAPGVPVEAQKIVESPALFARQSAFSALGLFTICLLPHPAVLGLFAVWGAVAEQADLATVSASTATTILHGVDALCVAAFVVLMLRRKPHTLGASARLNLLGLTAVAAAIGIFVMSQFAAGHLTGQPVAFTDPIELVVFTMSITVAVAFAAALADRVARLHLLSKLTQEVVFVMVPPLALIFLVLGTIFIGVATPTEAGAMGATGALALALARRRLTLDLIRQAAEATAKLSAFVIFILIGSRVFSLTFYGLDGHRWVESMLTALPGGQIGFLAFINVFVFVLAFFLDFFEIAFIIIPLLAPAASHLGIDLIWLGVILSVNMQTSFLHPPFGFALFYLRSVAPREPYVDRISGARMPAVTTGEIYWGAVPFVIIQAIAVALVIAFPALVMHYKGSAPKIDPASINIELPPDLPPPPIELDTPGR